MTNKTASTLAGLLAALAALLLVACSQTTPEEEPDIQATVDAAVAQALSDVPVPGPTPGQPTLANPSPLGPTPGQPTTQATDDPNLRDISQSQHEQLDELITELMENPQILATCANEAGDAVPAPGSPGETEWYAGAAIRYSGLRRQQGPRALTSPEATR